MQILHIAFYQDTIVGDGGGCGYGGWSLTDGGLQTDRWIYIQYTCASYKYMYRFFNIAFCT